MFETLLQTIEKNWPDYLARLIGIIVILVLARVVTAIFKRIIAKAYDRRIQKTAETEKKRRLGTLSLVLQNVFKYVLWFIAIIGILQLLGLGATVGSLLATAGIAGLAIGIGAQSLIGDVVAGLFILFENEISVGDYVKIGDVVGTVQEIALRTTIVKGWRGELYTIPNGKMGVLINYSRTNQMAVIEADIAYEADLERAVECMLAAAASYAADNPTLVAGEAQMLGVVQLGQSGVTLRMAVPVQPARQWKVQYELLPLVKAELEKMGVEIPYNRLVVLTKTKGESQ